MSKYEEVSTSDQDSRESRNRNSDTGDQGKEMGAEKCSLRRRWKSKLGRSGSTEASENLSTSLDGEGYDGMSCEDKPVEETADSKPTETLIGDESSGKYDDDHPSSMNYGEIVSEDEGDQENAEQWFSEGRIQPVADSSDEKSEVQAANVTPQRSQVYKMPDAVAERWIFWPANFIIRAVTWQLWILGSLCSTLFSVSGFMLEFAADPKNKTADAKQQFLEHAKPVAADLLPKLLTFSKKLGWGILAVAYIMFMLSLLIVPVVLFEYMYITKLVEQPVNIKSAMHFNYTEARPSASVPLLGSLGGNAKSFSWEKLHAEVILVLPESDYNRQLGMFQVTAELYSLKADLVAKSSRPCMLKFRSAPIRHAKTLILSLPLLLDVSGEYQKLHLKMMELKQQGGVLVSSARVLIEPRAGFPPGGGLPEIYAAEIHIQSELPWKKSLMYNWKWTIYVWTAMVLFMVEVFMVLCCFRRLLLPKARKAHPPAEKFKPSGLAVKSSRSRSSSHVKKRVSFQE